MKKLVKYLERQTLKLQFINNSQKMLEREIISLCQKGKLENFGQLYEKYFQEIYKFVYLKTFDKELCEDITSQTFLKALDKINSFKNDENSNFRAWIYKISYNLIIDNYKNQKENINLSEILEVGYDSNFGNDFDNKEKLKKVFDFFETLNPKHKQILVMRIWDDLSYKEISELTGENLDNCKKIVSRSLGKIPKEIILTLIFLPNLLF